LESTGPEDPRWRAGPQGKQSSLPLRQRISESGTYCRIVFGYRRRADASTTVAAVLWGRIVAFVYISSARAALSGLNRGSGQYPCPHDAHHGAAASASEWRALLGRSQRLVWVVCVVYVWILCYGTWVVKNGKRHYVDRRGRRDKSYFRIGFDWIERQLRLGRSIRMLFQPYL